MIKKDSYVLVKPELKGWLNHLGIEYTPEFIDKFVGTVRRVKDIWYDEDLKECFLTLELCCEIPAKACELKKNINA